MLLKLSKDICIKVTDWTEGELQMTIDAKKIIPKLGMSLENVEWKALKNVKWGALIKETYDDIIKSVIHFNDIALRILQSKIPEDV